MCARSIDRDTQIQIGLTSAATAAIEDRPQPSILLDVSIAREGRRIVRGRHGRHRSQLAAQTTCGSSWHPRWRGAHLGLEIALELAPAALEPLRPEITLAVTVIVIAW